MEVCVWPVLTPIVITVILMKDIVFAVKMATDSTHYHDAQIISVFSVK